jgi:hypothetical protein
MRFRNLSDLAIPKDLWTELAARLKLDAALPDAASAPAGLYQCRSLRVTVRPRKHTVDGLIVITGTYTYGHVGLRPCVHCTPAFLTQVFLHELVHAWMHQYRDRFYFSERADALCERFADAGYRAIGGRWRNRDWCGSYRLAGNIQQQNMKAYTRVADSLQRCRESRLLDWKPPPAYRARGREG